MKFWLLVLFIMPTLLFGQSDNTGALSLGTQFYQNLNLPDNYQGFGVGLNLQIDIAKGIGLNTHCMLESNDLLNAGSIRRFQGGVGINYAPLFNKKLSPWVQVGFAYNNLTVSPISYLFSDNSQDRIEQYYLSLNTGIGGYYKVNENLKINLGFFFQPQNYSPHYVLETLEGQSVLMTSQSALDLPVDPLLYFNLGITYQIVKLW
ncbi:MAG: hypothetical protein R3279_00090 [Putridiphycobacter sp.]|nr:hypothetical protein [Putridiphycobacter sp.]